MRVIRDATLISWGPDLYTLTPFRHTVGMDVARVEIYKDAAGEWRHREVGANGEPFGDGYDSPAAAQRGFVDRLQAAIDAGWIFVDDFQNLHVNATIPWHRADDEAPSGPPPRD